MRRLSALFLALPLGAVCAMALASCGGEGADLLAGTSADQIESNLTRVEELADEGDCVGAEEAVAEVAAEVEGLQEVDLKLKAALQEGTAKLSEVVGRCQETEETEPSLESDVEAEEAEAEKKPKKEKPEDGEEPSEPKEEPTEPDEGPELPPQSNGKGEENGGGESPPPVEEPDEAPPSGGVGPGVGVE